MARPANAIRLARRALASQHWAVAQGSSAETTAPRQRTEPCSRFKLHSRNGISRLSRKQLLQLGVATFLLLATFYFSRGLFQKEQGIQWPKSVAQLSAEIASAEFFRLYWQRPIPLQGQAPATFSAQERDLDPATCGSCHPRQYADWQDSLHSRAMGPGPWGQIIDLTTSAPSEAIFCMTCHAPLTEQIPVVANASAEGEFVPNENFDARLQLRGITCAACHLRNHRRFGPPKGEKPSGDYPGSMANHGGAQRTANFEKAEFCKDCHQFDPENTLLINGKPLQDTYREWQNSRWARDGVPCQECHMSGRRHLWKGIHDKEWVKGGVQFKAALQPAGANGQSLELTATVINSAVGHKFPTYTTPKVFVRAALLDGDAKPVAATQQERTIGWDTRYVDGEWKEFFDTRILPGESFTANFNWKRLAAAKQARIWVEVHPDHFYHVHFYPAHLQRTDLSAKGRKLIEQALDESGKSPYVLFEQFLPLETQ